MTNSDFTFLLLNSVYIWAFGSNSRKCPRYLVPCQALFVGWVERSETQHVLIKGIMLGFAPLNPTYN